MVKSIVETLICGGPVMIPIFIVSIVVWTLIIEKHCRLKIENIDQNLFTEKIISFLINNEKEKIVELSRSTHGILAKAVKCLIDNKRRKREVLINVAQQTMHEEYPEMERHLSTIAILASIAPLLGLLGTVSGMVTTFTSITVFGTGDPQSLAKGISEALITTQSGLIVAIPALFFHNHLLRKVHYIMDEFEKNIIKFINIYSNG